MNDIENKSCVCYNVTYTNIPRAYPTFADSNTNIYERKRKQCDDN